MKRLLGITLLIAATAAHANPAAWFLGGAVVGSAVERRHPDPIYIVPAPTVIYQYQAPSYAVPTQVPVNISPEGMPYCPPGYVIVQRVNPYGYIENVGCRHP